MLRSYVGVDVSPAALALAEHELAFLRTDERAELVLRVADMNGELPCRSPCQQQATQHKDPGAVKMVLVILLVCITTLTSSQHVQSIWRPRCSPPPSTLCCSPFRCTT